MNEYEKIDEVNSEQWIVSESDRQRTQPVQCVRPRRSGKTMQQSQVSSVLSQAAFLYTQRNAIYAMHYVYVYFFYVTTIRKYESSRMI